MKTVQHHPSTELLTAFAAGGLPLSQALCISTHVEHCDECRQNLRSLDKLGGQLLQELVPAQPINELRQRVLDKIARHVPDPASDHRQPDNPQIPRCLHQFIATNYADLPWHRISPGIRASELCRDSNGARVELLRIKPGGSAATHTHLGEEFTVILEGSFSDEDGIYKTGDFIIRDSQHTHTPVATLDRECICLVVTEAPVQFTGFFSRLLNPLIRRSYA